MIRIGRRNFLIGAGGLAYALPALEGLTPREAKADAGPAKFLMVYAQPMGVCQGIGGMPETYWPDFGSGELTSAKLESSRAAGRTLGMLKDFASDIAIVRGVKHLTDGEGHEVGKAQVLTGSGYHFTDPNDHHTAVPLSEDITCRFAREHGGGSVLGTAGHVLGDPVGMYIWSMGKIPTSIDYKPKEVFDKIFSAPIAEEIRQSRRSVNDRVKEELASLRNSPKLSTVDRQRLERHTEALRLIELRLSCQTPDANSPLKIGADTVQSTDSSPNSLEECHKLMLSLIAFGLQCGAAKSVRFFARGGAKGRYTDMFDGTSNEHQHGLPQELHEYSHRVGAPGEAYDSWRDRLVRLDQWHQRRFGEFLKQLKDYEILDQGISIYHSEVGTGSHQQYNIPMVIAGSAGGRLRTGQYIDMGAAGDGGFSGQGVTNNKLLATIGAALGLQDNGAPITQFGGIREGASEPGGYIDALKGSNFPG